MKQGIGYQKKFMLASAPSNRIKIQPCSSVKEKVEPEIFPRQNCFFSKGLPSCIWNVMRPKQQDVSKIARKKDNGLRLTNQL